MRRSQRAMGEVSSEFETSMDVIRVFLRDTPFKRLGDIHEQ
jgi:hypothetical protein